jgi:hypothetical protein
MTYTLHALAIACYALIAFLILHEPIFNATTHGAGYDYPYFHWNFWWVRRALTTGSTLFYTDFVFYPHVNNLSYHTLALFWYPLWALLEPHLGTLIAMTIILWLGCLLSGYAMFALLRSEGAAVGLALLGGIVLQASPIMRYYLWNTHINLTTWFWLPLHLLLVKVIARQIERRCWARAMVTTGLMGATLAGMILSDLQFAIFSAFLLVPYSVVTLWRMKANGARLRLIGAGMGALGVALSLLWGIGLLPALLDFRGTLAPGLAQERPGIPFPTGFLTMHAEWWEWHSSSLGGFVAVAVILTLLVARRASRRRWLWLAVALPPFILALGPTLTLGTVELPLPYHWLHTLTAGNFRMPWRVAPVFIIAAMVFVALAWTPLVRRWGKRAALPFTAALILLVADVRLFESAPLWPVPPAYGFYAEIGKEAPRPEDDQPRLLIEVPTAVGTGEVILGPPRAVQLQAYGLTHGQKMINGFIARAPVEHFWAFNTDDPLISWLGQRQPLRPDLVEPTLRRLVLSGQLGYIVIHQNLIAPDEAALSEIFGYFNALPALLCPAFIEGEAVAYRATSHPLGCSSRQPPSTDGSAMIDLGSAADRQYLGWGWHGPEQIFNLTARWAGAHPEALLYLDLPPGAYRLSFHAQAFYVEREVAVALNGTTVGAVTIAPDALRVYTLDLPAAVIRDGTHTTLTLRSMTRQNAAELGLSADARLLSIMVDWVRFAPLE